MSSSEYRQCVNKMYKAPRFIRCIRPQAKGFLCNVCAAAKKRAAAKA